MLTRRLSGAALVLAATLATGLALPRVVPPQRESTEAFREKGPAAAPVTIVEYSDFECPVCRAAEPAVRQVLALYGNRARFIFKHFPLHIHPYALAAAVAAECAGRQGKFWPYHDLLYERQAEWTNKDAPLKFEQYARELGLDEAAFKACRSDPAVARLVEADAREARLRWVGGTPTFFINGKRFVGAWQLRQDGVRWIDEVLKK
ncbi:MAG: thioredoxin domain-containing protein [Elusimicrobia bacterium]|nr:thioredoxin domain-containing protein [Elusimicrobiota bacterium]MDE2238032.1 thioredoxin domain-containing protein [Elusimicrobiota bacterium]MDE2426621.1 thioredoxin domain-containing protein [Elusimicrobiota bacterium]